MRQRMFCLLSWMIVPAVLSAAEGIDLDRRARTQEAQQQNIAITTKNLAQEIDGLADEMGFNGIASPGEIQAMRAVAKDLTKLADANVDQMMPWIQAQLAAARGAQAKDHLGSASAAQTKLVDVLEKLYEKMQKKAATSATSSCAAPRRGAT